jgi:hypothetical protein
MNHALKNRAFGDGTPARLMGQADVQQAEAFHLYRCFSASVPPLKRAEIVLSL